MENSFNTPHEYYLEATSKNISQIADICKKDRSDIYVLYSGGCDSTLVLYETLKEYKDSYTNVNTISFKSKQLAGSGVEAKKRKEFIKFCSNEGLNVGEQLVIDLDDNGSNGFKTGPWACPQPAIWLYNVLAFLPVDSIVLTGYIRGDDFLTFDVFNNWFNAYNGINNLFGKNIMMYMPLAFRTKDFIIKELISNKIDKFTSYCENPINSKPCGECESCNKHKAYYSLIKSDEKDEKKYRETIKAQLKLPVEEISTDITIPHKSKNKKLIKISR